MIVDLAATTVALLLVLGALTAGAALFLRLAPKHAGPIPPLCVAALLSGLATGAALLLAAPGRTEFHPARLFAARSAWTEGGLATALSLALPSAETLRAALAALAGDGPAMLVLAAWLALATILAGLAAILRTYAMPARLHVALAFLALAVWTALTTRYATQLLAWGLAQLGFWTFLLALVLLQRWRHKAAH